MNVVHETLVTSKSLDLTSDLYPNEDSPEIGDDDCSWIIGADTLDASSLEAIRDLKRGYKSRLNNAEKRNLTITK